MPTHKSATRKKTASRKKEPARKKPPAPPQLLLLGRLQRDTIITADGQVRSNQLGGNLVYAASAARLAGAASGLVARVGADFPNEWLLELAEKGFDTRGIRRLEEPLDLRRFIAYSDLYTSRRDHPIKHFGKRGLPFPKGLLGYAGDANKPDSKRERTPATLRPEDIPETYQGAKAAHLCPLDYLSHTLMPAALRDAGATQVTLDANRSYMHPAFWDGMPQLINGLTVFHVQDALLRLLFTKRTEDLWTMVETIAAFNCDCVVVRHPARGYWLYERASRLRLHLPPYPARTYDVTDSGSSFCAAFAAELVRTGDMRQALLTGAAVSSLAIEGNGGLYVMDTLPGLAASRAEILVQALKTLS